MSVNMSILAGAGWQFFDNNGVPLAGGKLETYLAGTTTPAATYTTIAGTIANSNPIVFDAAGRVPNEVWLTQSVNYKFVLKDANNNLIGTYDNIAGINDTSAILALLANTTTFPPGSDLVGFKNGDLTSYYGNTIGRTVYEKLSDVVSIFDYIPVQYQENIKNNTSTDDVSVYVQNAVNSGKAIYWPAGTYIVNNINNDSAPDKRVVWIGQSKDLVVLTTTSLSNYVLRLGNPTDSWGTGGSGQISNMYMTCNVAGWQTYSGSSTKGFLVLNRCSDIRFDRIKMYGSGNCGMYIHDLGYASITECNIGGVKFDCINLDSTNASNAVTSTLIESCQLNTGLRSSVRIYSGFNITVTQCQLEGSNAAILIEGNDNRSLVFTENYVESTTGDYDINASSAAGISFTFANNYLFGTPNIATINLPTNPEIIFTPVIWYGNFPSGTVAINGSVPSGQTGVNTKLENFSNVEWLQGSRSISGIASLTGCYAWSSSQQNSIIRADQSNNFGAGMVGTSVGGFSRFGLLRGSGFDASDPLTDGYFEISYLNRGSVNTPSSDAYALHIYGGSGVGRQQNALKASSASGINLWTGGLGDTMAGSPNAAETSLFLNKVNSTSRSINAAGTINASGADYAEYMEKAGDFVIAKGDVCGVNAQGKLTNVFVDAISFVVKSTDPSYVGGDTWGVDLVENKPKAPDKELRDYGVIESDEEFAPKWEAYQLELNVWNIKLEEKRSKVDRIAFAGQVPVNVTGAIPGQYIIPIEVDGKIIGQAVSAPTFEQYQIAVGKVIAVEDDGRARIIVKVA